MFDRDQVEWLKTLIAAYREEHDFAGDDDPSATIEMLQSADALAAILDAQLKSQEGAEPPAEYATCDDDIPF